MQQAKHAVRDRERLMTSISTARWLARQGLAFRGDDESKDSKNRGNFIELIRFAAKQDPKIADNVLENAPGNNTYTSPTAQKEIIQCCAEATRERIKTELGDSKLCILVDESRDVSSKEQLTLVIRYVTSGRIVERFLGLVHVPSTKAEDLWKAIQKFLTDFGLSVSDIRGQGYDGASNMRGDYKGLKTIILGQKNVHFSSIASLISSSSHW